MASSEKGNVKHREIEQEGESGEIKAHLSLRTPQNGREGCTPPAPYRNTR